LIRHPSFDLAHSARDVDATALGREVRIPKDEGNPIEFARRFLVTGRGGA
jgi:hypothetical protein